MTNSTQFYRSRETNRTVSLHRVIYYRDPAKRGHGALRLAQNQPLIRPQGGDLARDWFVRRTRFHPLVVSDRWLEDHPEFRFSG
jgi:hypothetical protein